MKIRPRGHSLTLIVYKSYIGRQSHAPTLLRLRAHDPRTCPLHGDLTVTALAQLADKIYAALVEETAPWPLEPVDLDQGPPAKLPASPIGAALDLLQPFENPEGT